MSGPSRKEAAGRRGGYTSLNLHNSYRGSRADSNKPYGKGHGLQSLGKVGASSRRMISPASIPSMKSENAGNDPSINLVPSGGGGWKKEDKENQAEERARSKPSTEGAKTQQAKSSPATPDRRFRSDFPSLGEPEPSGRRGSEEREGRHREGGRDGEKEWSPDRNSRPPGDRGWRDPHSAPPHGHGPPGPPNMGPYPPPHGPYPSHHPYPPYMMPPGPHRHGVPPYGSHPMPGPGGPYPPPPPHGPYPRPPYPPRSYPPHNPYEVDPYQVPPRKGDDEEVSRPPTVKADDLKSMELLEEEEEGGWAGHHDEVDYTKEVVFEDSSDDESVPKPERTKKRARKDHRVRGVGPVSPGERRVMVAGQPKEGDREQYRDRGNRDADDRERNHERERGKDPRRTDGGRGESSLPDGPRHAPQYPPYPYPYPPYDYGYHMYPPPPGQGHPYPVQHGYPQRYGGQFSDRERKSGHPSEWEREEHHDKHDFHPWAEGDHRPKRRWAGGEKERGSEKPPRILTKPDERKDSQKAGDAKDEIFTDLGADRGRPSTAIKKVESLSSDTAESLLKQHVTFADDKKEVPHSPVDGLPSSPVAPKMRSQQKKIIMRKLGEESPPERQDPPPSGGVKPSKERPKDLKPIPPGEPRSGEVSPDSKTPDSAALGAKGRQMAWNVNDRGPITSPKTLYEPEGKKSAVKFLRYQHASRDGGPKDRNKEGGEKEDRGTAASPSTPTGDIKVLPKEASEKDSQKMEEEETPPEKKTQAPSPSGERGLGEGGGRGDDKGETRKEKSKRLDSGEKPSYERERQDPREKQHRKEDGAKERASQQKQEVVSQDHDHWEPQPKEKEPEKERVGRRKPMESVGRGRGARERILQETRQITRQQEPGRGRGRDRGDRQEGSLPRDRRKRDFQEEPSHPGRDRRDVDQWERGRTDRPSLRPRREENRKPPPPKEREGGRQGGGKSRGEGRKEGRSEQPPPPTTISKESKPANAQLLPSTGAAKPTDVQPSATPVAAKPATTIEVHPRQSILGEPPGKTFAELYAGKSFEELHAETAGFQQTDFSRLPRKPVAVQQAEGVTARAQHLVSKPAPSEGRVPVVEEQGEPKSDRRKSREAKGDEREGRRHDNRPRDGGYPPQREGGQRLDRDRDRGDKGGRPPQRERDRSERGYKANVKLSRGEQFEREGRETGDRRPHPRDSRRSDHPDKGEGRPPPRGQQPPGRDKPLRKKGETLDEPTKATHPQGSRRPPQATAQPQKRRENEETNLPSLGYTNLEVIDSDWEEDVLQLEQELDEDEGKTPQSEKKSQERGQRSERSEQSYPRGAPRTGRGGGPQRRNQRERRERNDQQSHEFAPKDFRAPVGRGRTEDGGGRKDRRVGDPLARPGSYSNQRRQGGKDGGRGDSRQGNRQHTPSEGSGGLDSLVNNAPPAKEKTPQTAGDKRVSDFERYDLNSLKVAIVDDIGGGNVEPGRFSPLSQGGFVEVTSKKDKKEKLKKEKEEQRRAEEEHRRQQDEERQRKNKVAYSHPRQGSPPQLAWAATKPDSDLWGSDGSGGAQWLSPLLHSSSSAPGAPLSLPQQMWTLGAHSPGQYIGVIGDTLQNKPLLSTPGVHPVLQTSSMENTTYSLFGASSTVTPFAPTGLTPSGHMLNSAVSLTFPGSSEEPFPSEDPLGTATEPVATASPDEPPEEEGKEEDVADKDGGPEFKKVEKRMKPNKSSLPPRFQQGKQSGAGRGRGMGRGGDRRERERESKPVGGSRHEKALNGRFYAAPHQRGEREPLKVQRSTGGGGNDHRKQAPVSRSFSAKPQPHPRSEGSSKHSKVA